ncbi:D-sedoheptulose 7-phosphate isomerase [Campylobacter jejuni]|nr:D-sedoheptulose 7-phosphate isomerase [Campylobacter jejuni]
MENLNSYIKGHFQESILVKEQILKDENLITLIKNASLEVIKAYKNGNKTLLAGNGGSAADAQHIAGEFVSRFYFDRPGIASIALTTDTSVLTAIGNDYGYANLFARQVQAQGVKGDVFIGISTSGNSKNILKALELCKQKEIISIGLSGAMNELCDYCIKVPSTCTPRIQEAHILIGHIICAIVEEELFGKGFSCKQ